MKRSFAFTASHEFGELQLGGYDPQSIDPSDTMRMFKMVRDDYGVKVLFPPALIVTAAVAVTQVAAALLFASPPAG